MKTRKRGLIAAPLVYAAFLCAALTVTGCPAPITEPTPPPPLGPSDGTEYDINFDQLPMYGEATLSTYTAKSGTTVTLTVTPSSGYELDKDTLAVFMSGNRPITPPLTGSGYSYSFTMPASAVWVRVRFIPLFSAMRTATSRIAFTSSWDDIDYLNTMIKKAQSLGQIEPDDQPIQNAIEALRGTWSNQDSIQSNERPGAILTKILNEDFKDWITFTPTSFPIDKNAHDLNKFTNLYYVKDDHPTFPAFSPPGKGWDAGARIPSTEYNNTFDGLEEINLRYEVGDDPKNSIRYKVVFYPVAQYHLEYEQGATSGSVELKVYTGNIQNVQKSQTLSASSRDKTDDIWKNPTPPNSNTDTYLKVVPGSGAIRVRVTTGSGGVTGIDGVLLSSSISNETDQENNAFYVQSKRYTIWVRPRTAPNPINDITP